MKYIYTIAIVLLLFSCGKQDEQPKSLTGGVEHSEFNSMVGESSVTGGGYGVPESESGIR